MTFLSFSDWSIFKTKLGELGLNTKPVQKLKIT